MTVGIGIPCSRIVVRNCDTVKGIVEVVAAVNKLNITVRNLFLINLPEVTKHDIILHLDITDSSEVIFGIEKLGYMVEERKR